MDKRVEKRPSDGALNENPAKIKIQQSARPKIDDLLHLNESCLFEIFDRLESLNDLCTVSQVCTRLQSSTGNYFEKKYSFKWKHLHSRLGADDESYIQCFEKFIKNVVAYKVDAEKLSLRSEYNQIIFIHCYIYNNAFSGTNCLEKLSTICFMCCDIKEFSLSSCPKLKNLIIYTDERGCGQARRSYDARFARYYEYFDEDPGPAYTFLDDNMMQQYPTLERFHCTFNNQDSDASFLRLLQINTTIKTLVCHFFHTADVQRTLKTIAEMDIKLEELYLAFCYKTNTEDICNELKPLCDRDNLKRLEICFHSDSHESMTFSSIEKLKMLTNSLTGIHCILLLKSVMPLIASLSNLTTLHVGFSSVDLFHNICNMTLLAKNLHDLEEYVLEQHFTSGSSYEWAYVITPFVRWSVKLKTIMLLSQYGNYNMNDEFRHVYRSNEFRKKLKGSSKLTIFFDEQAWDTFEPEIDWLNTPCEYRKCKCKVKAKKLEVFKTRADDPYGYYVNYKKPFYPLFNCKI